MINNENINSDLAIESNTDNTDENIKNNPAIGKSWDEVENQLFSAEEIAASNLRVALIGELIKARQKIKSVKRSLKDRAAYD